MYNNKLFFFLQSVYTTTIFENSPDGTQVVTVDAIDKDRPDSNGFHLIRFYMDDDRFDVDPLTVSLFFSIVILLDATGVVTL